MKVLFVSPETPAFGGAGIATYLEHATAALSSAGHECHILTWTTSEKQLKRPNYTYPSYKLHIRPSPKPDQSHQRVDPILFLSSWIAEWVLALHHDYNFDLIEGTDWGAPLHSLLQRRNTEKSLRDVPITIFHHGTTYNIARHEGNFIPRAVYHKICLEHHCFHLADRVLCPSQASQKHIMSSHGVPIERITLVPEPIFTKPTPNFSELNEIVPLFYGTLSKSKGIMPWIFVANKIIDDCGSSHAELIGWIRPGKESSEAFKARIINALKLPPEAIRILGPVHRTQALKHISTRHALINMSPRETFCYAFAEGILAGATPIALAESAQAEFIPPELRGEYSILPSLDDIDGFKAANAIRAYASRRDDVVNYISNLTDPQKYTDRLEALSKLRKPQATTHIIKKVTSTAPVSVLIPAHEPTTYLLDAVESANTQTIKPASILVGNDGSQSSSSRIILEKVGLLPNVRVINWPWKGLSSTRNRLLDECPTPYFVFLDSDDLLDPHFIEYTLTYLLNNETEKVAAVQTWYEHFGTETGVRAPVIYQHHSHLLWNDLKNTLAGRTEVFRSVRYCSELQSGEAEDWEFWLRFFLRGWNIRVVPKVLWKYRRHSAALSYTWSEAQAVGTARAISKVMKEHIIRSQDPRLLEFIAEYMYMGEKLFQNFPIQRVDDVNLRKSLKRLERFRDSGQKMKFKHRMALRLLRALTHLLD